MAALAVLATSWRRRSASACSARIGASILGCGFGPAFGLVRADPALPLPLPPRFRSGSVMETKIGAVGNYSDTCTRGPFQGLPLSLRPARLGPAEPRTA